MGGVRELFAFRGEIAARTKIAVGIAVALLVVALWELAARAGFDPRASVTLWQKMSAANSGAPPQWLSTHPSGTSRIEELERSLPKVMPLFERARRSAGSEGAPAAPQ